jgi:hypothetical protein
MYRCRANANVPIAVQSHVPLKATSMWPSVVDRSIGNADAVTFDPLEHTPSQTRDG